jgi:hypothetical protein
MRRWQRDVVRGVAASFAAAGMVLVAAIPAFADGNGATTTTYNFHNTTQTFPSANPCSGVLGSLTVTFNGVVHQTINKAGDEWDTGTMTGDFVFVPSDTSQPTYTGHFETWFGDSLNNHNTVNHFTFHVHGIGSDGSILDFSETAHLSTNASGAPVVVFDKASC